MVALTLLFIDFKLITLLSILFGAGLAIQADRVNAGGRTFARYYLWRMVLLFLIGLGHALLLWHGDILTSYAIVGVMVLFLIRWGQPGPRAEEEGITTPANLGRSGWLRSGRLLLAVAVCLAWFYGWFALFGVAGLIFPDGPPWGTKEGRPVAELLPADETQPLSLLHGDGPEDPMERFSGYFSEENQVRISRHGSLPALVEMRMWSLGGYVLLFWWLVAWHILACFLIGVCLMRTGVFHDLTAHRRLLVRLFLLAVLVGLPLQIGAALAFWYRPNSVLSVGLNGLGAIPHALGYLVLLVWWSQSGRLEWLQRRLRAVGRMALTNYLMQSVLCGLFFYSYGLQQFGRWDRLACLGVVAAVWALALLWSPLWLRWFEMGPVEWAWRSLADGRLRPFRRRNAMPQAA